MNSDIATKIIAAIVGVLASEVAARMLDSTGLSEKLPKLSGEIIKAVAGAAAAFLVEGLMRESSGIAGDILKFTGGDGLPAVSESANCHQAA